MVSRTLLSLVVASLAVGCSSGKDPRKLVIFHTNDEHSHLVGIEPEADDFPQPTAAGSGAIKGGIARRYVKLQSERAAAKASGADVLTVSAGDNNMGTLAQVAFTTAAPDYRLMKLLGYDVTCLGNHEFDFGPAGLAAAISAAKSSTEGLPQIVSTNIHFSSTSADDDSLAALYDASGTDTNKVLHKSWVVTTDSGLKVGFVGIMGIDAAAKAPLKAPVKYSQADCCGETDFASAIQALFTDIGAEVRHLRRDQKVDVVIALSHSGVDLTNPLAGEDTLIALNVPGIDVIVSGHTHTTYPAQVVTNLTSGAPVLIQQAGRFGDTLGKIALTVNGDGSVSFDTAASALIPIDDTIVPDPNIAAFISGVYAGLEGTKVTPTKSFLELTLQLTTGQAVTDNAAVVGDLAFKPIAKGSFKVDNSGNQRETQLLDLTADAVLKTVEGVAGTTNLGVEAAGVLRGDLTPSKAGTYAFADIFNVVPLGASPIAKTVGYPLTRFSLYLAEIKAAFEVTAGLAYTSASNGDFYIVPSGFCFKYDMSRPAFNQSGDPLDPNNGRVTEIRIAPDHNHLDSCSTSTGYADLLFSATDPNVLHASPTGYTLSPLTQFTVGANLYVTTFAYLAGVVLKDPDTGKALASPSDAILYRDPSTKQLEVKEWEALGGYLQALSPASGSGDLPASYKTANAANCGVANGSTAATGCGRRAICFGSICK